MFTFSKSEEILFYINDKPVYAQFQKDPKKRIHPFKDSKQFLGSDEFRERYNLSRMESNEIQRTNEDPMKPMKTYGIQ